MSRAGERCQQQRRGQRRTRGGGGVRQCAW